MTASDPVPDAESEERAAAESNSQPAADVQPAGDVQPAADLQPAGDVHRLHPVSLLFRVGVALRQLFIPLLLVVFASGRNDTLYWVGPFVAVSVIHGVFHYLTYRYRFDGDELVVRGGVLFRFERHIPYERIQNIDLSQSLVHRLFGVADVRIETGSGAQAEARLQVLSLEAVERVRARVFAGRAAKLDPSASSLAAGGTSRAAGAGQGADGASVSALPGGASAHHTTTTSLATEAPQVLLHKLDARDLLLFGLLSNRGLAIVLAVVGLVYELGFFDDEKLISEIDIDTEAIEAGLGWGSSLLLAFGVIALMKLLSVAWAIVNLYGFELRRRGDDLQVSAGLFTRHTATLPRRRIQVVSVTEGWWHRLFGHASVKVDTAGGNQMETNASTRRWVAPLIARDALPELLHELLPRATPEQLAWTPVRRDSWKRVVKRSCLLSLAIGLIAGLLAGGWWASLSIPLLVWSFFDAPRRVAAMGWARAGGLFAIRSGLWTRRVRYVPEAKVQVVRVLSSPFDRRWGMARVLSDTAGTPFAVNIAYLDRDAAHALADQLSRRASQTDFAW